jgi:carbon monoxide dehydrogenase subunit G
MPVIEKTIEIHAAVDTVFAILDTPQRIPEYVPGITRVDGVQHTDGRVGDTFRVTYSVLGISFPLRFTLTAWARPQQIDTRVDGALAGSYNWSFMPHDSGMRLAIRSTYAIGGGPLGWVANALLIERMNEKNTERMLDNLKALSEGRVPTRS